jgi:hypothetical protein
MIPYAGPESLMIYTIPAPEYELELQNDEDPTNNPDRGESTTQFPI